MSETSVHILRFIVGGSIIAGLPVIGKQFGPEVAGVVALIPAIVLLSFIFLGLEVGPEAVRSATISAFWGFPSLAAFLLALYGVLSLRNSLWLGFSCAGFAWVLSAGFTVLALTRNHS